MSGQTADRTALDAQYNLRAAVPEFQDYFDRYDRMSAEFRARHLGRLDLPYGRGPDQAIDLFLPKAADPPLLAFIHGGYWHTQDRKRFSFVAGPLVEQGMAVALIGYDLAPAVDMDAIVEEIRAALGWLHGHAPELGFDRDRMHVAGHSAGGHLSAMALATDWHERGLPADVIKGVCAISGVFDLEPVRLCYLNDVLAMTVEQARRNSPNHLAPRTRCPVLVTVGANETRSWSRVTVTSKCYGTRSSPASTVSCRIWITSQSSRPWPNRTMRWCSGSAPSPAQAPERRPVSAQHRSSGCRDAASC